MLEYFIALFASITVCKGDLYLLTSGVASKLKVGGGGRLIKTILTSQKKKDYCSG